MPSKQGTSVKSGSTEVAAAGTAVRLTTEKLKFSCVGVWVVGDAANTEAVVVGDSTVKAKAKENNGVVLGKGGAPVFIEISDPSELFVDAQKEKEKVSWLAVLA